jgi:hypothetical protein
LQSVSDGRDVPEEERVIRHVCAESRTHHTPGRVQDHLQESRPDQPGHIDRQYNKYPWFIILRGVVKKLQSFRQLSHTIKKQDSTISTRDEKKYKFYENQSNW